MFGLLCTQFCCLKHFAPETCFITFATTTGLVFAFLNLSNAFCSLTAPESVFACFQLKNIFSTLPPYKQHVFLTTLRLFFFVLRVQDEFAELN